MPAFAPTHPPLVQGPERKPLARGAVAGLTLLSALLLSGAVGAVVGALVGAFVVFLIVGIFAGFVLGIVAVRARFSDL
jgi:F0F1-type ATP synthase assembly protein I